MFSNREIADQLNEVAAATTTAALMQTTISRKDGRGEVMHAAVEPVPLSGHIVVPLIGPSGGPWLASEVGALFSRDRDDPLRTHTLAALARAQRQVARIPGLVSECRDAGATWQAIGAVLGITKQGAHERFGRGDG